MVAVDVEKRSAFEGDGEVSDSSDEDGHEHQEVEVTFEPGKNHRRKSSIDVLHATMPTLRHPSDKRTECVLHQFLDSQERAENSDDHHHSGPSSPKAPAPAPARSRSRSRSPLSHPHHDSFAHTDALSVIDEDVPSHFDTNVKPRLSFSLPVPESGESAPSPEPGQPDEQAWQSQNVHSIINCTEVENSAEPASKEVLVNSRLLTKKQLSDMAWGVRELSRRLSSIRLKPKVKSLFVLTKIHDRDLIPRTRELVHWLLAPDRDRRYTVYVEDRLLESKRFDSEGLLREVCAEYAAKSGMDEAACLDRVSKQLRPWDAELCRAKPHLFDFIVTLGGDGTVLYASWLFQNIVPPTISFALGSLGFLTKFEFSEFPSILRSAIDDGVTVSLRLRFEGTVMRSVRRRPSTAAGGGNTDETEEDIHMNRDLVEELVGEEKDDELTHRPDGTYEVLNEIVVDRGPNPTLSNMEVFGDDEHFTSILADGMCISTPTGSTAYNLAAGGSLCHPENPIMLLTSICPHTLSFRPIILPDTIVLRVGVPYSSRTSSWASFDGRERVELQPGDYVTIAASRFPFATVQAEGRGRQEWVKSISGKLGWNTRQKQKSFTQWDKK